MWANRTKPRTPCNIVLVEDVISPASPKLRMYNSTWARWIPTNARRTGPGTRPPPAAQWSSLWAGTAVAAGRWTWITSRDDPRRGHAVLAADMARHSNP